tara:strand:+ start:289 stop:702 length:414 start_codon:yes stop_codon:yes gene_type:complete
MKLREKIFKQDSDGLFNCDIYYNEELTKGLYLVGENNYIKRNVKSLEIEYQVPDTKEQIGVKFSKQYEFVVMTIILLDDNMNKQMIQYIIKESCTAENIYNCRHHILEGFRDTLVNGLQMLYATTLQDVMDWTKENN